MKTLVAIFTLLTWLMLAADIALHVAHPHLEPINLVLCALGAAMATFAFCVVMSKGNG